jgi:hypothetical protein
MALYEMRTYTLRVGAMAEAVKLYQEIGFPALQKGSHGRKLVGYFQADTGAINRLLHLSIGCEARRPADKKSPPPVSM